MAGQILEVAGPAERTRRRICRDLENRLSILAIVATLESSRIPCRPFGRR